MPVGLILIIVKMLHCIKDVNGVKTRVSVLRNVVFCTSAKFSFALIPHMHFGKLQMGLSMAFVFKYGLVFCHKEQLYGGTG